MLCGRKEGRGTNTIWEGVITLSEDRTVVLTGLIRELVGPAPCGDPIDCNGPLAFSSYDELYRSRVQMPEGEEIVTRDRPTQRYGVAVLYPRQTPIAETNEEPANESDGENQYDEASEAPVVPKENERLERVIERVADESEADDYPISLSNAFRPSSMGLSFLLRPGECTSLKLRATGGRYHRKAVHLATDSQQIQKDWWLRQAVNLTAEISADSLLSGESVVPMNAQNEGALGLDLRLEVISRPHGIGTCLVTVCLVNRTVRAQHQLIDDLCLFQARIEVQIQPEARLLPYPGPNFATLDDEQKGMELLYRHCQTFAVGHGCAANWDGPVDSPSQVTSEAIPTFEAPSITPDVTDTDKKKIVISMAELASLKGEDTFLPLIRLVESYGAWITKQEKFAADHLEAEYKGIASDHLEQCRLSLVRMLKGIDYLRKDALALRAFQLSNWAMLLQQSRGAIKLRDRVIDPKTKVSSFAPGYSKSDFLIKDRGLWRPFQIGFLLSSLESVGHSDSKDREIVELIWFPTGGGKTEAYLGLAAFSMLLRRLRNPKDTGVDVLMRYTLRLLTAQQFERASALICSLDHIRREPQGKGLGVDPFSIGIWLGQSTTPNTNKDATALLKKLVKPKNDAENLFLLKKCPWCAAEMGPLRDAKDPPYVIGYRLENNRVGFHCPDSNCEFYSSLPIYVVDEDIYNFQPSMVIATVDKFAMLAFTPDARKIFGLGPAGNRVVSPPTLILQDELHLISGPLGSMVGLYEVLIQELCSDFRNGEAIPKIVCSTATIRNSPQQILALFARRKSALFPAPELTYGESFFARFARDEDSGALLPGRLYCGIHAPGLGSVQTTQVRTFTSLLQTPCDLQGTGRDAYWTLVAFYNSLRELGGGLTLFQSDVPDYQRALLGRLNLSLDNARKIGTPLELTGRLSSEEVPEALAHLQQPCTKSDAVSVCLASNILEVGVDVDRLSLMAVVGQPKSTASYIQISGRVGRKWWERPGLVATIYNPSKPRDRSHYERFRTYHERLYSQVEPTSLTPYSKPTADRALHAVLAAYVRLVAPSGQHLTPSPYPEDLLRPFIEKVRARVALVDELEIDSSEKILARRISEWTNWQRVDWHCWVIKDDAPLMRPAGNYAPPNWIGHSWATPTSMRNVDAECQVEISHRYSSIETEENS